MGDRHAVLDREISGETATDLVDRRQLAGLRLLPLRGPTTHLSLDVSLPLREVTQADGVDVDRVQIGQDVDQMFTGAAPLLDRPSVPLDRRCRAPRRRRGSSRRTARR